MWYHLKVEAIYLISPHGAPNIEQYVTRKSLEARNAPQVPIVYKRQKL